MKRYFALLFIKRAVRRAACAAAAYFIAFGAWGAALPEREPTVLKAGDITIVFDAPEREGAARGVQPRLVRFPVAELSNPLISRLLTREKGLRYVKSEKGHETLYAFPNGASVSCSFGDAEYQSKDFLSVYAPLFAAAKEKGALSADERDLNPLVRRAVALLGDEYNGRQADRLLTVYALNKEDLALLRNAEDAGGIAPAAAPFCCVLAPVLESGVPVLEAVYDAGGGVILGTQRQILLSEEGVEFFYSGRSLEPSITPQSTDKKMLLAGEALALYAESLSDIIVENKETLHITDAELRYIPIPRDERFECFVYAPHWIFTHENGGVAIDAYTGESLM